MKDCNYHLCKEKKKRTYKCKFCGEKFCSKHKRPVMPYIPSFKTSDKMMYSLNDDGHPCMPYADYLEEKEKQEELEYGIALEKISKKPIRKKQGLTERSEEDFKGECSYHLCRKKPKNMKKCKFCDEEFCDEHLRAVMPYIPSFRTNDKMMYTFNDDGHPCMPYAEYEERERKLEDERYGLALDNLLRTPKLHFEGEDFDFYPLVKNLVILIIILTFIFFIFS